MQQNKKNDDPKNEMQLRLYMQEKEPEICKHFGCGRRLTLHEELCGDKCVKHSKEDKVDIMNIIRFK